jgi:hypothetical protein
MPTYPTTKLKILKYNSPSGTIKINKWVPPFKKVDLGFGFVGVLAEDTETGRLQCHECGGWYEVLTSHIFAKHQLTSTEYCEKFGLLRSTALKSMRIRNIQSKVMLGMRRKHKKHRMGFKKGNKESANRRGKTKAIEAQNRFGVCDLQIVEKIKNLKRELGRTPALTEIIDKYGGGFASIIHSRYDGYLKLVRDLGWKPVVSSRNPKYSKEYFVKKGINAIKKGKKLIGCQILNQSEERNIYHYFSSQKDWRVAVRKSYGN